jgi:hypothetical protein
MSKALHLRTAMKRVAIREARLEAIERKAQQEMESAVIGAFMASRQRDSEHSRVMREGQLWPSKWGTC